MIANSLLFIDIDFNTMPRFEFGKEWSVSNSKSCDCKLDSCMSLILCQLHQEASDFGMPMKSTIIQNSLPCSQKSTVNPGKWNLSNIDKKLKEKISSEIRQDCNNELHPEQDLNSDLAGFEVKEEKNEIKEIGASINKSGEISDYNGKYDVFNEESVVDERNNLIEDCKEDFINEEIDLRNPRFHKYSEFGIRFDVRYDLMNKNFIRAVKREFSKIFDEFLRNYGLKDLKRSSYKNCKLFAYHLI